MKKAVLFIIFNRIEYAKQVFEQIRLAKPPKLYIASDGAREYKVSEAQQVENIRKWVLANIDWNCEVKTRFLEKNSGKIGLGVSDAINWFFENEEDGIIFEEDCVPNQSFFQYCEELLDKYKDDKRIWHITGDAIYEKLNEKETYYFAKIPHIWGWATWSDRWQHYKFDLKDYDEKYIQNFSDKKEVQEYWLDILQKMKAKKIDTWDYQWAFCVIAHKGYSITPYKNLINNIGDIGVHSSKNDPRLNRKTYPIDKIVHPKQVKFNNKIINLIYREKFGITKKHTSFLYKKEKFGNRRIITLLGFIKIKYKKRKEIILKNVINGNFAKKVLISYIRSPFEIGVQKTHSNFLECYTAAKIFDKLGFCVDVIEYTDDINTSEIENYNIVYGFGKAFEKSLYYPNIKSIFYGTGCATNFSNKESIKRVREFYKKTGLVANDSARYYAYDNSTSLTFSNLIIPLGNQFVANTYKLENTEQNIQSLNAFYYDTYNIPIENKDYSCIKRNFLWFGSSGALHKGLDLVIEVFKRRNDINLFICGLNPSEKVFYDYYEDVLSGKYTNINNCGFVNIESSEFKKIMNNTSAVIFPSVSEGGAVAILNVMANGGLVPIISEACGLNVENYGFQFSEISEAAIENKINEFLELSCEEIKNLSRDVKNNTRAIYSYENYKKNLETIITNELY